MIKFIRRFPEILFSFVAMLLCVVGLIDALSNNGLAIDVTRLWIGWLCCILLFSIIASQRQKQRRKNADVRRLEYIKHRVNFGTGSIKFMVPFKSNYGIVNLYRKLKGLHAVRLYVADYGGGIFESYSYFLLTKKELFEMKLNGRYQQQDFDVAKKLLESPELKAKVKV